MSSPRSIARAAARGKQPMRQDNAASTRNLRTITGRVYVASSLSTYRTARYERMIDAARSHFPQATILPARDQFTSTDDWRRRWPDTVPTLAALIFFDDRGSIGRGVYQEVDDARAASLPVFYLPHPTADLLPYDGQCVCIRVHGRSWAQYAEVLYLLTPDLLRALGAPDHVADGLAVMVREPDASQRRSHAATLTYGAKGGA